MILPSDISMMNFIALVCQCDWSIEFRIGTKELNSLIIYIQLAFIIVLTGLLYKTLDKTKAA